MLIRPGQIGAVGSTRRRGSAVSPSVALNFTGPVVANSIPMQGDNLGSTGSALVIQSRLSRAVLDRCNNIRIGASKTKQNNFTGGETVAGTVTQVKKFLLEVGGVQYPATWSGAASTSWSAAQADIRLSDPIVLPGDMMPGDEIIIWTETTFGSAFVAGLNTRPRDANDLQAVSTTSTPPSTLGTTVSGWTSVSTVGPEFVVGSRLNNKPTLVYKGDSNMSDQQSIRDSVHNLQSFPRATIGSGRGIVKWSATGNLLSVNKVVTFSGAAGQAMGATDAIVLLGTNDVRDGVTLATIQADMETLRANYAAFGITAHFCTLPPTDSTDSKSAVRIPLNDWLRGPPSGFAATYDLADACETARNSGVWKSGYTNGDFLHINWSSAAVRNAVLADHAAWLAANGLS